MRLTFGQFKQSRARIIANIDPSSDTFREYTNEAIERIFWTGENFFGLTQRFRICPRGNCLTMPRAVASVEAMWNCNQPVILRNQWFEYLDSGPWLQEDCRQNGQANGLGCGTNGLLWQSGCGYGNALDRGTACTFRDITGLNKKIKVYADVAEDADVVITLQGFDENRNWIRTEPDGVGTGWIDGEQVAINVSTPQLSTKFFSSLVSVIKPVTNGAVRLYEYNTDTTTQLDMAVYEPSETLPSYRRVYIPGLECVPCCGTCDEEDDTQCRRQVVTIIGRMEFIPVQVDNDWINPPCPSAIKDMIQAVRWMEQNDTQEALVCEGRALNQLRTQLRHYLGHSTVSPVKMLPVNVAGPYVPAIW